MLNPERFFYPYEVYNIYIYSSFRRRQTVTGLMQYFNPFRPTGNFFIFSVGNCLKLIRYPLILGDFRMPVWKKIAFLMVSVFVVISFSTPTFADHNDWQKDDYKEWQKDKWKADKERWKAEEKAQRKWEKKHRKAEKKWRKAKRKHRRDWEREFRRDWRDEVRYSQGHHHHHPRDHHAKKHQEHYPERDHKRSSGGHDKPTIEGGVDIGVGIHIPFP